MTIDKIIVSLAGLVTILLTHWFFFGKKEEAVSASGEIIIIVEGGYKPATIRIEKGKPTIIHFLRHDPNPCLEEVVLSDFKIKKYLPLNEKVTVSLTPHKSGTFPFSCGMNMFHGKIIVV